MDIILDIMRLVIFAQLRKTSKLKTANIYGSSAQLTSGYIMRVTVPFALSAKLQYSILVNLKNPLDEEINFVQLFF